MSDDADSMMRAIRLARRGQGAVEPNPMVGCVIVRAGNIVGEGWHRRFGSAHAEVEALRKAGARAKGATAYVTLEPCGHHGKTPPCAEALIAAGVKRVVVGTLDPHKKGGSGGAAKLRRAGVAVDVGVCGDECAELTAPFAKVVTQGLPYVTCKWAATVDGSIATRSGDSRWISSPQSRAIVHTMRARVDAIVVGVSTAIADDPMLTARDVRVKRVARRVVIDPTLRLAMKAKLIATAGESPVTIAMDRAKMGAKRAKIVRLERAGVEVIGVKVLSRKRLDLRSMMRYLVQQHGATNVLVEGGGVTTGQVIGQGLCDELMVFVGPRVLGDAAGRRAVDAGWAVAKMAQAMEVRLVEVRRVGPDAMLRYRI